MVDVRLSPTPQSTRYVQRKLEEIELDHTEIWSIVQDIYHDRLTDTELTAYLCGLQANGLSLEEMTSLTECMADVGGRITWDDAVIADKHCIGGVPGNRTTSIVAERDGVVTNADNGVLAELGRWAGTPKDKGAGVVLHVATGDAVDLGDPLLTIHAEPAAKRDDAPSLEARADVFRIRRPEEMVIDRV